MEFRFNVNEIFKTPIVEITSNLVPPGFQGDRRQLWEAVTKVSEVINTVGQASASAQGLTKPITTAERLRNAENQRLYLLIDRSTKTGKGCITGMLKTGKKGLYVFDREGQHYQVQPNCILDFYIHESRQRTGLGKHLFEHMLQKEEVDPVKLAIDRPSDKFLAFLKKHYKLEAAIRQMNNYVVFEGFFPKEEKLMAQQQSANNNTDTPTNRMTTTIHLDKRGSNGLQQQAVTSPYGRYGAPRPPCSMGQIIHNQSAVVGAQEPTGETQDIPPIIQRDDQSNDIAADGDNNDDDDDDDDDDDVQHQSGLKFIHGEKLERPRSLSLHTNDDDQLGFIENGTKNMHMVEEPVQKKLDIHSLEHGKKTTPSHLTEQGYFDLKFYHNKLW